MLCSAGRVDKCGINTCRRRGRERTAAAAERGGMWRAAARPSEVRRELPVRAGSLRWKSDTEHHADVIVAY